MFKWQKKVLSLLVMMFMFSFGFNCSAIEDYLIYFGCQETSCSQCGRSLARENCISDFHSMVQLIRDAKWDNCCYIHFERNADVDAEKIYKNKDHCFCKNCMMKYFVDAFDNNNDNLLSKAKQNLKDNSIFIGDFYSRSDYEVLAQNIEKKYIEKYKDENQDEDGRKYIPLPCEYTNINKINRFDKCSMCYQTLITSLYTAACGNEHMICFDCAEKWEKRDDSSPCYCKSRYWLYSPVISGEGILHEFRNKYVHK